MQETYKTEYFHDHCIKLTPSRTYLLNPSGKLIESYKFNGNMDDDARVLLVELIIADLLNITHPCKNAKPERKRTHGGDDFYIPFPEWFYRRTYPEPLRMAAPMASIAYHNVSRYMRK